MKVANWVPDSVIKHHISRPYYREILDESLLKRNLPSTAQEAITRVLVSSDEEMRRSWELLRRRTTFQKARQDSNIAEVMSFHHSEDDDVHTYRLLYSAFIMSCKELPKWLEPDTTDLDRNERAQQFKKHKKNIMELKGFVERNNLDVPLFDFKCLSQRDFQMAMNRSTIHSITNRLLQSNHEDTDLNAINKTMSQLTYHSRLQSKVHLSNLLQDMVVMFNYIENYPIQFSKNKKYGNSGRNYFIFKLASYFEEHLGSPLYRHVAMIVQVVSNCGNLSEDSVKKIYHDINRQLKGTFI
jgi:hypothetical protein